MSVADPPVKLLPRTSLLIGDERISAASGGEHLHIYAGNGKPTIPVVLAGAQEMRMAVQAARSALSAWSKLPPNYRRDLMLRLSRLIVENAEHLTALQITETALPRRFAATFPATAADYFTYNAGWIDKIGGDVVPTWPRQAFDFAVEEPYGVVAIIMPWNGGLMSLGQLLGPALAAGNTVVLKPSELAPFTSLRIGELVLEAGFPAGVVNVVPGGPSAGEALICQPDVDKIHFTGSDSTAKKILAATAESLTPVSLELGGKSPLLIFDDADLIAAAEQAVGAAIALSGQECASSSRVLAHSSVYDRVVQLTRGFLRRVIVGDPFDDATVMGPVVSATACSRILTLIERAKLNGDGRLVFGGERLGGHLAEGYYIAPTLFADVDHKSRLAQEEIFGPVVSFFRFEDEEEAIRLANDTRYGLAAHVYTNDLRRGYRVSKALAAGNVWINGVDMLAASLPFGGTKQSGHGRVGGRAGIREFTRPKNVWVAM